MDILLKIVVTRRDIEDLVENFRKISRGKVLGNRLLRVAYNDCGGGERWESLEIEALMSTRVSSAYYYFKDRYGRLAN